MGSASSIDTKQDFETKFDSDANSIESEETFEDTDSNEPLLKLPKPMLVCKIREMQKRLQDFQSGSTGIGNNSSVSAGHIPRSAFSDIDPSTTSSEVVKAKDVLIAQLDAELRACRRQMEEQKSLTSKRLSEYAAEITDLRFKSCKRINQLEKNLEKYRSEGTPGTSNTHRSTALSDSLILKLSEKINLQSEQICQLGENLARKDEIIEGFRLYESSQYGPQSPTSTKEESCVSDGRGVRQAVQLIDTTANCVSCDMTTTFASVNNTSTASPRQGRLGVNLTMSESLIFDSDCLLPAPRNSDTGCGSNNSALPALTADLDIKLVSAATPSGAGHRELSLLAKTAPSSSNRETGAIRHGIRLPTKIIATAIVESDEEEG